MGALLLGQIHEIPPLNLSLEHLGGHLRNLLQAEHLLLSACHQIHLAALQQDGGEAGVELLAGGALRIKHLIKERDRFKATMSATLFFKSAKQQHRFHYRVDPRQSDSPQNKWRDCGPAQSHSSGQTAGRDHAKVPVHNLIVLCIVLHNFHCAEVGRIFVCLFVWGVTKALELFVHLN